MKTVFLLQNNHVISNTIPVSQYAWKRNIEVIDRSSHSEFDVMDCGVNWDDYDLVIPYGSVQLIRHISESPIAHWVNYKEEKFRTDEWVSIFKSDALNYDGVKVSVSDVKFRHYEHYHIRPNSKDKAFIAQVFSYDEWDELAETLDKDLEVFVSIPKEIFSEYRCWVINGKVVEISQYMCYGSMLKEQKPVDSLVGVFAQSLIDIYRPFDTVVIDIAGTNTGFKFIEFNSFHGSGWYAANITRIFDRYIKEYTP